MDANPMPSQHAPSMHPKAAASTVHCTAPLTNVLVLVVHIVNERGASERQDALSQALRHLRAQACSATSRGALVASHRSVNTCGRTAK